MKSELRVITPEQAKKWLEQNTDNRAIRPSKVDLYADQMKAGHWHVTHQGIAFAKSGRLLDGQHRLHAIVKANVPVEMLVSNGMEEETFKVIDQAIRRTAADILQAKPQVAQVSRMATRIIFNTITGDDLSYIHGLVGPLAAELHEFAPANATYFSSAGVRLAAVATILKGGDKGYVFNTYANLVNSRVDLLPPVGQALVRSYLKGILNAKDQADTMARAMIVFDEASAAQTKVMIKDANVTVAEVRRILSGAMMPATKVGKKK